ncbi:alpha-L-rhamnosidase [Paenibacillus daejeonensis]|uniref:alpha-L-rhamnosidase n=1 Tax=Paenibacillus daejeonensis TaxID=135193 RepID=UPI000380AC46|nr:alpha-L-rhamnosidase [Paenibacillus daejeonensis]
MKWESEWIWRSSEVQINDFAYFRKSFDLPIQPASARLFVSCHHYAQVYVNGIRLGGYGTPAPTDPEHRKLYTTYEVADLLIGGCNCITADAHYLGGDCQNSVNGRPGFRLELHWQDTNGKTFKLLSDTSWQVLIDMPHQTGTPYQQNRRISAIEAYDARKLDPQWRDPGGEFRPVSADAQLAAVRVDEWPMQRQTIPEGHIGEEIVPEQLGVLRGTDEEGSVQIFDAGRIVSGWPRIRLKGYEGMTLRMRYSENLNPLGRVGHNVANEPSDTYYDEYTMRGDEVECWQPDFSYKSFRFVEITGYPDPITEAGDLVVCAASTALPYVGHFECSDELLNRLYEAAIYTQKNNMLGQLVDCPHREQAQYLADTELQSELLLYNFDAIAMIDKTLCDFADAQLADGTFPFVAPTTYEHPSFHIQIPEWDLHYATLLWKVYEATGESARLADHYATMTNMIAYYLGIIDSNTGLVPTDKGWHISDWPYPSVDHKGQFLTVQQIKLIQALDVAGKAAALLGKTRDWHHYEQQAKALRKHVNWHLYLPEVGGYKDSLASSAAHQGVSAIALFADVVPQELRGRTLAYVKQKEWECSTVLSLPLLRMLFDNGCGAEAYAIIARRAYPGWLHMIQQGSLTLWEGWQDIESHSHAWNGYPARLLQEYLVGILSTAPGFKKAVIRPFLATDLTFAEASIWTIHGNIYARWEKTARGQLLVTTDIPAGIATRLELSVGHSMIEKELTTGVSELVFEGCW